VSHSVSCVGASCQGLVQSFLICCWISFELQFAYKLLIRYLWHCW